MKQLFLSLIAAAGVLVAAAQKDQLKGLQVGDKAPNFTAVDNAGKRFELSEQLKKGEVVLVFYRGQWCPFCNRQLSKLNDSLFMLQDHGAAVVAVSPETMENVGKTVSKTKATFPVISDEGRSIMKKYKVNFTVDDETLNKYKGNGIDIATANGSNGATLPVPATYIIGMDGRIKYVFFDADYKKRPSVQELIDHLHQP